MAPGDSKPEEASFPAQAGGLRRASPLSDSRAGNRWTQKSSFLSGENCFPFPAPGRAPSAMAGTRAPEQFPAKRRHGGLYLGCPALLSQPGWGTGAYSRVSAQKAWAKGLPARPHVLTSQA